MGFLRRKLGLRPEQSILCYINRVFSPGLDEGVGGLWKVRLFAHFRMSVLIDPSASKAEMNN